MAIIYFWWKPANVCAKFAALPGYVLSKKIIYEKRNYKRMFRPLRSLFTYSGVYYYQVIAGINKLVADEKASSFLEFILVTRLFPTIPLAVKFSAVDLKIQQWFLKAFALFQTFPIDYS